MMDTIEHNPNTGIYPADDYIHAIEVRNTTRTLYISGTMGLDNNGVAGKTIENQLVLVWDNIRTILKSADMSVDNIVRLTSYMRSDKFMQANADARLEALNNRKIPTTAIIAQTLMEDWLIEIEVIAMA